MHDLARMLQALVETDLLAQAQVLPEDLDRFDAERVAAQWTGIYGEAIRGVR